MVVFFIFPKAAMQKAQAVEIFRSLRFDLSKKPKTHEKSDSLAAQEMLSAEFRRPQAAK